MRELCPDVTGLFYQIDKNNQVLETGQVKELANHTALIAKDGTERSIADSAGPIRDDNGNLRGVILFFGMFQKKR